MEEQKRAQPGEPGRDEHRVVEFPGLARVEWLAPVYGKSGRGPERVVKVLLALVALFAVLEFNYPFGVPAGAKFDRGENGVWIDARWSGLEMPMRDRVQMVQGLARKGIRWIYADEGALRADGGLDRSAFMYAGALALEVHAMSPRTKLLAWISGENASGGGGKLNLESAKVRARVVEMCKYFTEQMGFDGVQLDIEPAPSGDEGFLRLLEEVKGGIGEKKTLSVAAMKWTPVAIDVGGVRPLPYSWDEGYYREVFRRANQVVLMGYDTGIPFANVYVKYLGWQTGQVLEIARDFPKTQVLIGVPTYEREDVNFHAKVENMGSGLQGVIEALEDLSRTGGMPEGFGGVAIFADWTTTQEEWALFGEAWRKGEESASP